ncbi:MAG: DUF2934 domain-containing protein [Tepidisphaeraceae bacterium]
MPKYSPKSKFSGSNDRKSSAPATAARNTPVPRPFAVKPQLTHEMIAKRAYEIYRSGKGGSQVENWLRAERELKS